MFIIYRVIRKIKNLSYMLSLKKNNVVFRRGSYATTKTVFEGSCIIGRNSLVADSYIGKGSYLSDHCVLNKTQIGRYCCIAQGVKVVSGQHPLYPFVSISPVFYSHQLKDVNLSFRINKEVKEHKYVDSDQGYRVKIGNDVWIGTNALIMEGIRIYDGAVIAAGAVVTEDVKPYSIVGGVPAKVIKMRFKSEQIKCMLQFKWWERDNDWLKQNSLLFDNIEKFISEIEGTGQLEL